MKNILIVGASKGMGLALANLMNDHYKLYTISRTMTTELSLLHTEHALCNVVTDSVDGIQIPDILHGVVYCPGSINLKPFNRLSEEDYLQDFQQNLLGAVKILKACLPSLKRANGAGVVLYSTVAAKVGMPFHASVAASKAAVEGFARSIAAEWASSNIRVNVIAPSLTDTPLAAALLNTPEKKEGAAKRHPLQIIGTANDMANMTEFLLSDKSNFITGQVISIDGGMGALKV